ncbi:MAG: hypothetical protein Ct9H300mP16_17120 [Pseudomonadota bacterium]|nr:MAG: hypothetical protein Ct9H300mP16_17120 [Pseudomonadota bacterium]
MAFTECHTPDEAGQVRLDQFSMVWRALAFRSVSIMNSGSSRPQLLGTAHDLFIGLVEVEGRAIRLRYVPRGMDV